MRSGVAVMSAMLAAGCATTAAVTPSAITRLAIERVGVEPKTIDVQRRESATIRYSLTQRARVTVDVVDENGVVVRTLDGGAQSAGAHTLRWDGWDRGGHPVSAGVYRYIITARAMDHGLSTTDYTYDPSSTTGGEELKPWNFSYDDATHTLRWVMPKAGLARVRVGLQGFPHLRTLLDWQPLEAGDQTIAWDGLDASGLIRLSDHPNRAITIQAFAIPWNTIIVRNHLSTADEPPPQAGSPLADTADEPKYPPLHRPNAAYLHARHPRKVCHDVRLQVEFPGETRYDTDHQPVLAGVVPVRVSLMEKDASRMINSRFEVALFEDTAFLFEEEDGSNPFTYLWDTSRFSAGRHLLTVNVLSYDDHYGVLTTPVTIERASQ